MPDEPMEVGVMETPVDDIVSQNTVPAGGFGADAPEEFQGKSPNDVYNEVQQLRNTVRVNEELIRRMAAEPPKPQVIHVGAPAPTVAPEQQGPTEDELTAMIADDDPKVRMQAWNIMQQRNNAMLGAALERRLAPLQQGTIGAAEANARAKYALEFELFPAEIEQLMARVPREAFTNPKSWDELMTQVRGMNPMKYVTELQKRSGTKSLESVRAEQANDVGFVPPVRASGPPSGGGPSTLTDLQRKIAAEFNMTEKEYLHFDRQGDLL